MPAERREWVFRGRVQGVGFRATARHIAQRFAVVGYVENQPDGSVYLVAEGEPAELQQFRAALTHQMGSLIGSLDEQTGLARGEFFVFSIRT